jgi:hypothetical protein
MFIPSRKQAARVDEHPEHPALSISNRASLFPVVMTTSARGNGSLIMTRQRSLLIIPSAVYERIFIGDPDDGYWHKVALNIFADAKWFQSLPPLGHPRLLLPDE